MKSLSIKAVFLKATTAALVAGALLVAAPQAHAQRFVVGAQFDAPAYSYDPGFYDHLRWQREQAEIARRDSWIQRERREHREVWRDHRGFYGYPPRAVPYNGWR